MTQKMIDIVQAEPEFNPDADVQEPIITNHYWSPNYNTKINN